jgi:hypothetical protein
MVRDFSKLKELERQERERMREERKAQQEIERERARLDKERQHHENARQALINKGDLEGVARISEQLAEIDKALDDVDFRAANIRAGTDHLCLSNRSSRQVQKRNPRRGLMSVSTTLTGPA